MQSECRAGYIGKNGRKGRYLALLLWRITGPAASLNDSTTNSSQESETKFIAAPSGERPGQARNACTRDHH